MGPLLFALALHPLIRKIKEDCLLSLQAWYFDDGTLIGGTIEVAKTFKVIHTNGPRMEIDLNVGKTEIFCPLLTREVVPWGFFRRTSGVRPKA